MDRWYKALNPELVKGLKGPWTPEEDEKLTNAVQRFGRDWKKIAEYVEGRTNKQCLDRWSFVIDPALIKNNASWSTEQDELLIELVKDMGACNWSSIAEHLPGKISKQCRERWHNHLDPKIKKTKWSLEEDLILYILQKNHGNKWTEISQILEGRAENSIKNHWNASMSKKISSIEAEIENRL